MKLIGKSERIYDMRMRKWFYFFLQSLLDHVLPRPRYLILIDLLIESGCRWLKDWRWLLLRFYFYIHIVHWKHLLEISIHPLRVRVLWFLLLADTTQRLSWTKRGTGVSSWICEGTCIVLCCVNLGVLGAGVFIN